MTDEEIWWECAYVCLLQGAGPVFCVKTADELLAEYRKRFPVEPPTPTAPERKESE